MDRALLDDAGRAEILDFYGEVFGWTEGDNTMESGNPLILYTGAFAQFVYLLPGDEPLVCPRLDHFGFQIATRDELEAIVDRAKARQADRRPRHDHRREVAAHPRRGVGVRAHQRVHRVRAAVHGRAPAHRPAWLTMGRLDGKVAIVTGAARGTGAAIARRVRGRGRDASSSPMCSTTAARRPPPSSVRAARYRHLDVTDADDWDAVVDDDRRGRDGRLDVLVNNAAVLHLATIDRTDAAEASSASCA